MTGDANLLYFPSFEKLKQNYKVHFNGSIFKFLCTQIRKILNQQVLKQKSLKKKKIPKISIKTMSTKK